jgi:hypothetical protein
MKKQTAVEWLHEQLTSTWYDGKSSKGVLEIAKEMEKEQILEFTNSFYDKCVMEGGSLNQSAEEYYNETYNDNK